MSPPSPGERRAREAARAREAVIDAVACSPEERTFDEVIERVSGVVARTEKTDAGKWADRFASSIGSGLFFPSVPILSNAGRSGRLAACFVLRPDDSLDSIYETLQLAARIQQGSGGSGIDFSGLRPRNSPIEASGGVSPGPVGFLELYAHSAHVNSRAGRRPGAHLAILHDDHPDVLEFVRANSVDPAGLQGVGLAIGVSDRLMEEAERDGTHELRDPRGGVSGRVSASTLLDEIACSIHQTGDPTVLFVDAIQKGNPAPHLGRLEATNPCGEQPLLPGESCVLGSLHLPAFADERGAIDVEKLARVTKEGIRFLDDVVELNVYPDEWVAESTRRTRKVGLGVMGFADLLLLRGQTYGSEDSHKTAAEIMGAVAMAAHEATVELAGERGPYPEWRGEGPPRRNATVLAIAPTGTLLLMAGCSGGIEPFIRPVITVRNPSASFRWVDRWVDGWLTERVGESERVLHALEEGAPAEDLTDLSPDDQALLRRAWEVPAEDQIAMQAEFQRNVDGAVSKTVHLPADVTIPRIVELIRLAHGSGCKGVAFFRRGSERLLPRILPVEVDLSPPCCL